MYTTLAEIRALTYDKLLTELSQTQTKDLEVRNRIHDKLRVINNTQPETWDEEVKSIVKVYNETQEFANRIFLLGMLQARKLFNIKVNIDGTIEIPSYRELSYSTAGDGLTDIDDLINVNKALLLGWSYDPSAEWTGEPPSIEKEAKLYCLAVDKFATPLQTDTNTGVYVHQEIGRRSKAIIDTSAKKYEVYAANYWIERFKLSEKNAEKEQERLREWYGPL
jgi:hypothetical protein